MISWLRRRRHPPALDISSAPLREISWAVIYDPSYKEKPYYVELQFGGESGPGGASEFFAHEEDALRYARMAHERSEERNRLAGQKRLVARYVISSGAATS